MQRAQESGWIEVICGSMFSGKSEELIRRVRRAGIARQKVQVFKPAMDSRYGHADIVSHNGVKVEAVPVSSVEEMVRLVEPNTDVVAVDEVQFFETGIVEACRALADGGKRVIIAGLDTDFRGEPFGPTPQLMAVAEFVDKLQAICMVCGRPATRTQRLVNGEPAAASEPTILIGASETYEARCRRCHTVPRDPRETARQPGGSPSAAREYSKG